ncbi:MAG TPA: response regulator [Abditibacteriaceae bacterium]|jgi:hypothetical protein
MNSRQIPQSGLEDTDLWSIDLPVEDTRPLVLVIEDEKDMAELLRLVLRESYRLITARDGQEGIAKALQSMPDLILTDLQMPGLSGVNLLRELRRHSALNGVPIVVLTGTRDVSLRAELLRAGAQDYLTKPFAAEELLARLEQHLALSHAQATLVAATGGNSEQKPVSAQDSAQNLAVLASQLATRQRDLETSLEVLRQSRALFHNLARDFAHASGLFFNHELRFTSQQGDGLDFLRPGLPTPIGQTAAEVFSSEIAQIIEPHFRAALRGMPSTFEVPIITDAHSKGASAVSHQVLLMRALPVRDEAGAVIGGLAVAQDLRGQRLEEEEWQTFQARLLAQVEDAVNVIDPQQRIIYWNGAAARLYGMDSPEVLGRPLDEIYAYEWLNEGGHAAVLAQLEREGYWKGECRHRLMHDGRNLLVEVSLSQLREPDGTLDGFLAVIRDITARKKAEEARAHLQVERDELLQRLQKEFAETRRLQDHLNLQFECMPIGCIFWDTDFRVASWNQAATGIFGFKAEDVIGHHACKFIVPSEGQGQANEMWQRLLSRNESVQSVHENITREGRRIICQWSNTPFFGRDGTLAGVLSMVQDVTERKRAEAHLRLLSEASSAFVSTLDYESNLRALAQLCITNLAEFCLIDLVGRGVNMEWPEGDEGSVRRIVALHRDAEKAGLMAKAMEYHPKLDSPMATQVLKSGRLLYVEQLADDRLKTADDNKDYMDLLEQLNLRSCVVAPLMAHGKVIGLVKLFNSVPCSFDQHDIATIEELMRRASLALENAHLYGEAQQSRREAEAANRAKDEFLAVVSHELRTPLTPILGWVSMLRDHELCSAMDDEMRTHALDAIQQGAEVQSQIIDDLLDVSRIISGKAHLHTRPINLRNVVEAALAAARLSSDKKQIQIWTSFEPDIGLVKGDLRRLQQVVSNLLSNSIKFTPPGGHIEIKLSKHNDQAQLSVTDTGKGIGPEFLPRVFERFSQADASASRIHGGLGLGLSIVRHLVELHQGTVKVHSAGHDQGATFEIELPLLPAIDKSITALSVESTMLPSSGVTIVGETNGRTSRLSLSGLRLLVVDDESATRDMLSQILSHAGAEVEAAESVLAVRQILSRWKPNLIISDIGMPEEDGYALMRFVRSLHPDDGGTLPAIALSAYTREQDHQAALQVGYQKYLAKPVAPGDLIKAIAELMNL